MKRAKPNRKAPTLEPTAKARDLAVTPAVDAGVKGGEEKPKARPKLFETASKGQHLPEVVIELG
jgi:hypothetical protein